MKQRERYEDREEALRIMLDGFQAELWTALPAIVESFDPVAQTCTVQPTIKGNQTAPDGTITQVNMPVLVDVPVFKFRGGGFSITVPVKKDDEGLVIFSSRCIDNWFQSGGIQPQFEQRLHDLSDGFFLPGFNSAPNALTDYATDALEARSDDGTVKIAVKADEIDLVNGDDVNIKMTASEIDINAPTIKLNGIVWGTHVHAGVQTGSGESLGPQAP